MRACFAHIILIMCTASQPSSYHPPVSQSPVSPPGARHWLRRPRHRRPLLQLSPDQGRLALLSLVSERHAARRVARARDCVDARREWRGAICYLSFSREFVLVEYVVSALRAILTVIMIAVSALDPANSTRSFAIFPVLDRRLSAHCIYSLADAEHARHSDSRAAAAAPGADARTARFLAARANAVEGTRAADSGRRGGGGREAEVRHDGRNASPCAPPYSNHSNFTRAK